MANGASGRYQLRYRVVALPPGVVGARAVIVVQPALEEKELADLALCVRAYEVQRDASYSLLEVMANGNALHKLRDEIEVAINPAAPVVFCVEAEGVFEDHLKDTFGVRVPTTVAVFVRAGSMPEAIEAACAAIRNPSFNTDWSTAQVSEYIRQT